MKNDITPVKLSDKETLTEDEEYKRFNKDKLGKIRAAFKKDGTVTAGNSSKINDAGCALILMSEEKVKELKVTPLARIVSYADAEVEPVDFCIAPASATPKALERAGLTMD